MVHGNKKLLYFLEMDDLENIMSCKELQRWAKENGLEDDPVVHLRDLELTLDKIKKKHETVTFATKCLLPERVCCDIKGLSMEGYHILLT